VFGAVGVETLYVIDVREPEAVLAKLADAQRRFEKGGGVPVAVHDLLVELDGALADSGPFELDVSPDRWLGVQAQMRDLVQRLKYAPGGQEGAARARKVLGQLRRLFKRERRLRRWRAPFKDSRWLPVALCASWGAVFGGTFWLSASGPHSNSVAVLLALPLVFFFLSLLVSIVRTPQAVGAAGDRRLSAMHAPEERSLFASRLPRRQLVIATDQRVFVVSAPRRLSRSRLLWSISYDRINGATPYNAANARSVKIVAWEHRGGAAPVLDLTRGVEWRWSAFWSDLGSESNSKDNYEGEQKALVVIVNRRVSAVKKGSANGSGSGHG
jgi:hypothetical protein